MTVAAAPSEISAGTATANTALLLVARGLRAFGDGFVSLLLPIYLALLGFRPIEIGAIATATLLGSALLTLGLGLTAHRWARRRLLAGASLLMMATGLVFPFVEDFWPLLVVGFVGTLNPSAGDVSLFLPLEQALLAESVADRHRTSAFAHYSLVGSLAGAVGALAAGLPQLLDMASILGLKAAVQAMFVLYAALGLAVLFLYRRLALPEGDGRRPAGGPLGPSRRIVLALAALFSLDAFGGGFFVQSILALWLFDHFALSLATAAAIFFWSGVLTAFSYLVAVRIAGRFGLINTMVWTHLPANLCIMLMPFCTALWTALVLLFIRSVLSQMDVPTRSSYVMAVVTPEERAAAASITAVPRSLASAASPLLAGWLLTLSSFGWPLLIGGALKAAYDLMLWVGFRNIRPPEEAVSRQLSAVSQAAARGPHPDLLPQAGEGGKADS